MPARWSVTERASFTNAGMRQRWAQTSQVSNSATARAALSLNQPQLLLEQIRLVALLVDLGDAGELAALAYGQVLGVLPQGEPGTLQLARQRRLPAPAGRRSRSGGVPGLAFQVWRRTWSSASVAHRTTWKGSRHSNAAGQRRAIVLAIQVPLVGAERLWGRAARGPPGAARPPGTGLPPLGGAEGVGGSQASGADRRV
jgi:hypothetical protein